MKTLQNIALPLLLFALSPVTTTAFSCPPIGPVFPIPTGLTPTHPGIVGLTHSLDTKITQMIKALAKPPSNDDVTSFSVIITSLDRSLYEYHYTAPLLGKGSTKKVTGDTGFRIASISKAVTTLAALLQRKCMDNPVTKYVPELKRGSNPGGIEWDKITLKDLASHLGGLDRNFASFDWAAYLDDATAKGLGLPSVNRVSYAPCGKSPSDKVCTRQQFFDGIKNLSMLYHPADRSSYSNLAFSLLGYAVESITGKPYEQIIQDQIFKPLGMTHSSTKTPTNGTGAVPVVNNDWFFQGGHVDAAGGVYSTSNDLSKFMRGILNYKILPGQIVRNWLKPVSFTSSLHTAYGMPWEIYRLDRQANLTSDGRLIEVFTKNGVLTAYYSSIIMVPEFGFGITVLTAGLPTASAILVDLTVSESISAFDKIAREQTSNAYSGIYSFGTGKEPHTNFTATVDSGPGLRVTEFFSRDIDMFGPLTREFSSSADESAHLEARLFPMNVVGKDGGEHWRLAFELAASKENSNSNGTELRKRSVFQSGPALQMQGPFAFSQKGALASPLCFGDMDNLPHWAGKALTEVVFRRQNGKVVGADLPGFRVSLKKVA